MEGVMEAIMFFVLVVAVTFVAVFAVAARDYEEKMNETNEQLKKIADALERADNE